MKNNQIWTTLKTWICPDKCMVCGIVLEDNDLEYICNSCKEGLLTKDVCDRCGKPYSIKGHLCPYCYEMPRQVTRILALCPYIDLYKESVLRWKYTGIRKYARGYGVLMANTLIKLQQLEIDYLVPIPIARHRYLDRGFNQAYDLAIQISKHTQIPVWDILARSRDTKPQSACKKEERIKNIHGAIKLKDEVSFTKPIKLAFIDDIYTTGSTIKECIRVLQKVEKIEIETIYVLVVCLAI